MFTYVLNLSFCSHEPPCLTAPISTTKSSIVPPIKEPIDLYPREELPTKMRALQGDLKRHGGEKSIVFSFWTTTLDVVEIALQQIRCRYVRYDGRTTSKKRITVLEEFEKDVGIKVLFLSISCGAVGLNLIVASRAYLMEPHWNPTVEEQALARIHRMGQTREATTIRYIMQDSFEEHITRVQDRKKHLPGFCCRRNDCLKRNWRLVGCIICGPYWDDDHDGLIRREYLSQFRSSQAN
jgi:SNF2 family DNA or RNA helicase